MKKIISACGLAGLLGISGIASAADVLRFAVDPTFPPFEFKTAEGKLQGFDIDLGNAICKQAQVTCQWTELSFDGLIPALQAKKFDAILSSMSRTEKRQQQIAFSDMIYHTPNALVVADGSHITDDLATLKGKTIGVAQGTTQEAWAKAKWAPAGVQVVSYPNQDAIYPDLVAGRLDGTLTDAVTADNGFLKTPQGKGYSVSAQPEDKVFFGQGSGIGLRQGDTARLTLINNAIAAIHKSGEYARIEKKYFTFSVYPPQ
ncbi:MULTISPECIES: transporter substrate-binding domain-containing protein [Tatumella]|uniref:Transporter substrate-binding domain-containing protein n=1 Tax=Tatumella punctata TaxID=399969 RepID=A0ABW1VJP2_9GAMM